MPDHVFDDPDLEARVRAAEEWAEDGHPRAFLPTGDLVALTLLVVVLCVAAWLWGAP